MQAQAKIIVRASWNSNPIQICDVICRCPSSCLWDVKWSSFVKIIWKLLSLKMNTTLRVRSSGSTFCRNYQRTKGCSSCEELVVVIVLTLNTFVFNIFLKDSQLSGMAIRSFPSTFPLKVHFGRQLVMTFNVEGEYAMPANTAFPANISMPMFLNSMRQKYIYGNMAKSE